MNKSLKAFLHGYLLFDVNGKRFALYNSALAEQQSIENGDVCFMGFCVFKGWRAFFLRVTNPLPPRVTVYKAPYGTDQTESEAA